MLTKRKKERIVSVLKRIVLYAMFVWIVLTVLLIFADELNHANARFVAITGLIAYALRGITTFTEFLFEEDEEETVEKTEQSKKKDEEKVEKIEKAETKNEETKLPKTKTTPTKRTAK